MKSKILKLTKKPFVRSVIIMASGTAAAQVVTMALSPIITRIYGPEAYGLMGVFMSLVTVIAPIGALTYPIAIVLPKKDKEAKELIRLSLIVSIVISAIVALLLLFFHQPIVRWFHLQTISLYLYLIPIVVLCAGIVQVIEQWFIRKKQFGITAKTSFLQAVLLQGGKAGIGFFYPTPAVLIVLSALSDGFRALLMIMFTKKKVMMPSNELHGKQLSIRKLANKYKDFPLFRAPEVFLNAISQSLPILLLTSFFGPASAGFYSIGKSVLSIPSQLIGKSVGDVFYPRISEAANNGENLTNLIKKSTLALGLIGIIPYSFVIILGPDLFRVVFGEEWKTAGEYARWIALWSFVGFMNRPSVRALPILSAQAFHLKFTIFMLAIRVVVLALGYYLFGSDLLAVAFFGVSGAILNFILIIMILHKSKSYDDKM